MTFPESTPRDSADLPGPRSDVERPRRLALAPVLVVGAPRSGTTWLQRILLSLPACCGGQESHALCTIAKVLADFDRKAAMERPHGMASYLTREELLEEMRSFWIRLATPAIVAAPEATRLVEKTPDHAVHLDLADTLLPDCRVIHLVRDPRDVVASLLAAGRRSWGAGWAPTTPRSAAARWLECVEAAETSGARLGATRFLRIRYEDLRAHPEATLSALAGFLELEPVAESARRLAAAAATGGAAIPLFGELAGRQDAEPEGFAGGSPPLGAWARRSVLRHVGARMRALGYGVGSEES